MWGQGLSVPSVHPGGSLTQLAGQVSSSFIASLPAWLAEGVGVDAESSADVGDGVANGSPPRASSRGCACGEFVAITAAPTSASNVASTAMTDTV
jgi:hypothetical protein